MSENSTVPVTESASPFVSTTTPKIERANRLLSLREHPGFRDLIRLSQELVQTATDLCTDYPGWDAQQIMVLKVRMQAAKEHHNLWLSQVSNAIQEGIDEAKELRAVSALPEKSASDAVDQGDYVRQATLRKFEDMDNRPAGSY